MKIKQGRTTIWAGITNNKLTLTVNKQKGKSFSIELTEEATIALAGLLQGGTTTVALYAPPVTKALSLPEEVPERDSVPEGTGLQKGADRIVAGMD